MVLVSIDIENAPFYIHAVCTYTFCKLRPLHAFLSMKVDLIKIEYSAITRCRTSYSMNNTKMIWGCKTNNTNKTLPQMEFQIHHQESFEFYIQGLNFAISQIRVKNCQPGVGFCPAFDCEQSKGNLTLQKFRGSFKMTKSLMKSPKNLQLKPAYFHQTTQHIFALNEW